MFHFFFREYSQRSEGLLQLQTMSPIQLSSTPKRSKPDWQNRNLGSCKQGLLECFQFETLMRPNVTCVNNRNKRKQEIKNPPPSPLVRHSSPLPLPSPTTSARISDLRAESSLGVRLQAAASVRLVGYAAQDKQQLEGCRGLLHRQGTHRNAVKAHMPFPNRLN